MTRSKLDVWDFSVVAIYFVGLIVTGFATLFTSKRGTVTDYFLAGRFASWLPIGASLFASNIGSEHFIGLAGSGAATGLAVGAFELNASLVLLILGWIFLPVYIASGVSTLPQYMKKRFGGSRIQIYLAFLSLFLYVFTKVSVNLYSGSLFLLEAAHWNMWISIGVILILTTVITVTGGLTAVLYTDTLQFFVMIIGGSVLAILSFVRVGGFQGLLASYGRSVAQVNLSIQNSEFLLNGIKSFNSSKPVSLLEFSSLPDSPSWLKCGLPSLKAFKLLRNLDDPDMPWLGFVFGQTAASIWYWCADQMMVQRALAAKSLSHAQGATIMTGFIKQLPLFMIVIPGMISRVLFPNEIGCFPGSNCNAVCGDKNGCTDLAYPKLIMELMPSGLRGLMLSVMLAALISDLTSIFNSASTLFTVDIYQKFRQKSGNMELMIVGRVFIVVLVLVSVCWVPMVQKFRGNQLYFYIQSIAGYLTPPIASVYLIAVLWKKSNEKGAFAGLMYGLMLGLLRMILSIIYPKPNCTEEGMGPWIFLHIHYMYFAIFSFATTGLVMIIVSAFGAPPSYTQLYRLTYWTAWDSSKLENEVKDNKESQELPKANSNKNDQYDNLTKMLKNDENIITSQNLESSVKKDEEQIHENKLVKSICLWICGCSDHPCPVYQNSLHNNCSCCAICATNSDDKSSDNEASQSRFAKLRSLKQNPRAKIGLRFGLIFMILLSVFNFVFYTFFIGEIEIGPLPITGRSNVNVIGNENERVKMEEPANDLD